MQVITSTLASELIHSLTSSTVTLITNQSLTTISTNLTSSISTHTNQVSYSALGIFLVLFCFITVFGNGLVIYAIVQERYLKSGKKSIDNRGK